MDEYHLQRDSNDHPRRTFYPLLRSCLDRCWVVFVEAYVMNHPEVVARIHAGDYFGIKHLPGMSPKKSISREYADGVVEG